MGAAEYFRAVSTIRLDLLDLMGSGYVIEHCIAAISVFQQEKLFRCYVTDALKNINEIVAKLYGGYQMNVRYHDLLPETKAKDNEDNRTGDEIALDIIKRAGLKVSGGELDDAV